MKNALIATALGLAALVSPTAQAQTGSMYNQTITGTRLEISARGEARVVPDIAIISAGVVTQSADAATAMAQNATKMQRVMAALKRAGVADKDVQTQSISLSPQYRYQENQPPIITGYMASNQLTIRFRDIAKAGTILDILVKEGVNQINGPTLTIDKPEAAMDLARQNAMRSAREKAELYARSSGLKVARIVAITEVNDGGGMPMPVMAKAEMAADASGTAFAPGQQAIGVTVFVVFELQ